MRVLGAALLALLPAAFAGAQDYPDRPVHLVVPFPPGGGADILARTVSPRLAQALGKPIVVENKPGAGGNVGAEYVARAAPDGYTLLYGTNGTHGINASLYRNLRFDPVRDFVPVSRMTTIAALLIVNPKFPPTTVEELIRYARANPGRVNFASAGNGTTSHLAGELFKTMAGIDIVHVPYRGGAAAVTDLVGGQVQMMIDVMPNALPLARDGRARGIAVSTAARYPRLRGERLGRHLRSGRHAGGSRRPPERGRPRDGRGPAGRRGAARARSAADAQLAGRLRPPHRREFPTSPRVPRSGPAPCAPRERRSTDPGRCPCVRGGFRHTPRRTR